MSAVEIPEDAREALVREAVMQRAPDGVPNLQAGLDAAVPIVVSQLLADLGGALTGHLEIYRGMGDEDAARGMARAIRHLQDYKKLVDAEIEA